MSHMDKYIIELLKTHTRIILPELGAFITKKDEPGNIVFNEFLKFNDGVFVGYVAEKEKIEKEKALEKTENFVKEILLELERGKSHVIENLGEFKKDDRGKIQFIPQAAVKEQEIDQKKKAEEAKKKEEEKKKAEEAKKMEEEKMAEEAKKKEEEKKKAEEAKRKEEEKKKAEEIKRMEEEKTKAEEEKKEKKKEVKVTETKAAETRELIELDEIEKKPVPGEEKPAEEEKIAGRKGKDIEEITGKPEEKEAEKKTPFVYEEKKKSKTYRWLLLLLIPVALFLIWYFVLKEDKPAEQAVQPAPAETEEVAKTRPEAVGEEGEETPPLQTEAIAEEPGETEESRQQEVVPEEPEVEDKATQPAVRGEKRFYIVAGCFKIEANADKYVTQLRNKGYDSEKFGMVGRLHAVSVYNSLSRDEAIRKLNEVRESLESTAWLLYY